MASSTPTLVDAILTLLETNLPALLVAQSVPAIEMFYRHDPGELRPQIAPQLWVMQPHEKFIPAANQGTTTKRAAHQRMVVVQVTSAGADADTTARQLETYCDMIRVCLESSQQVGGADWVNWEETIYSEAMPNEDASIQLFQAAAITFKVRTISTRGAD